MPSNDVIQVAAVVVHDADGRILTVRKRGTSRFMFTGGKPEAGESFLDAAVRECAEETHLALDRQFLKLLGVFTAPAANEEGWDCQETLFDYAIPVSSTPHPSGAVFGGVTCPSPGAEIEELRWLDPAQPLPDDTAPLIVKYVHQLPHRHGIQTITFYTGSSFGQDPAYAEAVAEVGTECARRGLGVVYGGGKVGLMGILADSALNAGGKVIGVIPQALVDGELAHPGLTRLEIVADMPERKTRMGQLGDAMVALPGGSGTLEEFFEAWTWQQLGIHGKPVALYNADHFWDPLVAAIDSIVNAGFLGQDFARTLIVADSPADLIEQLTSWSPLSKKKWEN